MAENSLKTESGKYKSKVAASKKYDKKTYKLVTIHFRKEEDWELIEALDTAKKKGVAYREALQSWYEAYRKAQVAENTKEPDFLGVQNMVLQLGGQDKLESMQESGELDRLRDMILSDSRVQLVTEEYVSNAVR